MLVVVAADEVAVLDLKNQKPGEIFLNFLIREVFSWKIKFQNRNHCWNLITNSYKASVSSRHRGYALSALSPRVQLEFYM